MKRFYIFFIFMRFILSSGAPEVGADGTTTHVSPAALLNPHLENSSTDTTDGGLSDSGYLQTDYIPHASSHHFRWNVNQDKLLKAASVPHLMDEGQAQLPSARIDEGTTCDCSNAVFLCTCSEPYGVIGFDPGVETSYTFQFAVPDGTSVMVRFDRSDIEVIRSYSCVLQIGRADVSQNFGFLNEHNFFYLRVPETIIISRDREADCSIKMKYTAIDPALQTTNIIVTDLSGTLKGPEESSDPGSPNADLGYSPQIRINYQFQLPENYVTELTVTKLDLGWRGNPINSAYLKESSVQNDFLLIGIDDENGLKSDNYLLFGRKNSTRKINIKVNSPQAYVAFYGSYHESYVTGYEIEYTSFKVDEHQTTPSPPPTTTEPSFGSPDTALATVDSAKENYDTVEKMSEDFKEAIAQIATEFAKTEELDIEPPAEIAPEEVMVSDVVECLPTTCDSLCAGFYFSIYRYNSDHSNWAFGKENLDKMVADEGMNQFWKIMGQHCQYCDETVYINWLLVGGICASTVVLIAVIIAFVWKISEDSSARRAMEEGKLDNEQEKRDRERRPSDDASMIGVSKGGMRLSLPFKTRRESFSSFESGPEEEHDAAEFVDFDSDLTFVTYGLGPELMNDRTAVNFYSNEAFEPDSPTQQRKYQQIKKQAEPPQVDFRSLHTNLTPTAPVMSWDPLHTPTMPFKSSLKKKKDLNEGISKLPAFDEVEEELNEDDIPAFHTKSPKSVQISAEVHQDHGADDVTTTSL